MDVLYGANRTGHLITTRTERAVTQTLTQHTRKAYSLLNVALMILVAGAVGSVVIPLAVAAAGSKTSSADAGPVNPLLVLQIVLQLAVMTFVLVRVHLRSKSRKNES